MSQVMLSMEYVSASAGDSRDVRDGRLDVA